MKYNNVEACYQVYSVIQKIINGLATNFIGGQSGQLFFNNNESYVLAELHYHDYGHELTHNVKIPYDLLENPNESKIQKFIRNEITKIYSNDF